MDIFDFVPAVPAAEVADSAGDSAGSSGGGESGDSSLPAQKPSSSNRQASSSAAAAPETRGGIGGVAVDAADDLVHLMDNDPDFAEIVENVQANYNATVAAAAASASSSSYAVPVQDVESDDSDDSAVEIIGANILAPSSRAPPSRQNDLDEIEIMSETIHKRTSLKKRASSPSDVDIIGEDSIITLNSQDDDDENDGILPSVRRMLPSRRRAFVRYGAAAAQNRRTTPKPPKPSGGVWIECLQAANYEDMRVMYHEASNSTDRLRNDIFPTIQSFIRAKARKTMKNATTDAAKFDALISLLVLQNDVLTKAFENDSNLERLLRPDYKVFEGFITGGAGTISRFIPLSIDSVMNKRINVLNNSSAAENAGGSPSRRNRQMSVISANSFFALDLNSTNFDAVVQCVKLIPLVGIGIDDIVGKIRRGIGKRLLQHHGSLDGERNLVEAIKRYCTASGGGGDANKNRTACQLPPADIVDADDLSMLERMIRDKSVTETLNSEFQQFIKQAAVLQLKDAVDAEAPATAAGVAGPSTPSPVRGRGRGRPPSRGRGGGTARGRGGGGRGGGRGGGFAGGIAAAAAAGIAAAADGVGAAWAGFFNNAAAAPAVPPPVLAPAQPIAAAVRGGHYQPHPHPHYHHMQHVQQQLAQQMQQHIDMAFQHPLHHHHAHHHPAIHMQMPAFVPAAFVLNGDFNQIVINGGGPHHAHLHGFALHAHAHGGGGGGDAGSSSSGVAVVEVNPCSTGSDPLKNVTQRDIINCQQQSSKLTNIYIDVLSQATWPVPNTSGFDCKALPERALNAYELFVNFFMAKKPKRHLQLQPKMGNAEIQITIPNDVGAAADTQNSDAEKSFIDADRNSSSMSQQLMIPSTAAAACSSSQAVASSSSSSSRTYVLNVTTAQMIVLQHFEDDEPQTFQDLLDKTCLPPLDLTRALETLCAPSNQRGENKHRSNLLTKLPPKAKSPSSTFKLPNFSDEVCDADDEEVKVASPKPLVASSSAQAVAAASDAEKRLANSSLLTQNNVGPKTSYVYNKSFRPLRREWKAPRTWAEEKIYSSALEELTASYMQTKSGSSGAAVNLDSSQFDIEDLSYNEQQRQGVIDARLMAILKQQNPKLMAEVDLVAQVRDELKVRFFTSQKFVQERLNNLITRNLIKRDVRSKKIQKVKYVP